MTDSAATTNPLMARKPIGDIVAQAEGQHLSRSLGKVSITALGIGAIIGAGIFVLTGTAAARYAGPGIVLSFILSGVVCAFVGLCYAELGALLPVSGSTYTYAYASMGELVAWMIGWDMMLEYAAGAATVAVGWSGYAVSLLQEASLQVPLRLTAGPTAEVALAAGGHVTGFFNLPAALVVIVLSIVLMLGTRQSARLNTVMVALKLTIVAAFIVVGAGFVHVRNWLPLIPPNQGEFGHFGYSGLLRGAGIVFYAYIGFDAAATAAAETRDPQRDMPFGIIAALVICTLLYIAVAGVLTGVVPYTKLNVADPMAVAADMMGLGWFAVMIKLGALIGLTTVILVGLYGQSRILLTMAADGLVPGIFAHVHTSLRTPIVGQALIGACAATLAGLVPIGVLSQVVSIGTLFAFIVVCSAVIRLRHTDGRMPRPFRVPAVPWVPGLGVLSCLALMIGLPLVTWLRLVGWLAVGLVIYFAYGRTHARLRVAR